MLKIQSDRVIIDGHEPTKEQCKTMTLLANALAESEKFKTLKYESGYAEFERVGQADELKFVGEIGEITGGDGGGGTTSRKSVDLATLPGWANLTDGNHTIQIMAKADGYIDSEKSAGVEVTK